MPNDTLIEEEVGQPISGDRNGNNVRASWPWSLDTLQENTRRYRHEAKAALIAAFRWCIDPRHVVPFKEFAARVGYSDNLLWKVYSGKYLHPTTGEAQDAPAKLVANIDHFLKIEQERYLGGDNEFVVTPTAKLVFGACNLARESQSPVILSGPSHIGKTWAVERYTAENNHGRTIYCRMKAASGLGGMVRRIADRCGVSDKSNTADLIERIKHALTKDTLLILDEVHLLRHTYQRGSFFKTIEVIREIYDEAQCGMVLIWTHLDDLRAAKDGELQQIWRRGVHKYQLPAAPTRGDLAAILAHNRLEFPGKDVSVTVQKISERPYDVLRQLAKQEGLKAITERLRYGRKLAGKRAERLRWEHFIEAHLIIAKQGQPEDSWG